MAPNNTRRLTRGAWDTPSTGASGYPLERLSDIKEALPAAELMKALNARGWVTQVPNWPQFTPPAPFEQWLHAVASTLKKGSELSSVAADWETQLLHRLLEGEPRSHIPRVPEELAPVQWIRNFR